MDHRRSSSSSPLSSTSRSVRGQNSICMNSVCCSASEPRRWLRDRVGCVALLPPPVVPPPVTAGRLRSNVKPLLPPPKVKSLLPPADALRCACPADPESVVPLLWLWLALALWLASQADTKPGSWLLGGRDE